jgi:hypothetical protein
LDIPSKYNRYPPAVTLNYSTIYSIQTMTQLQLDNNYNADLLDAMADMADEQQQAMHETDLEDWEGIYDDQA